MTTGNSNFSKERLTFLLNAHISNSITEEQLEELSTYIQNDEHTTDLTQSLKVHWASIDTKVTEFASKEKLYSNILSDPRFIAAKQKPSIKFIYRRVIQYVAAAIVILGLGTFLLLNTKVENSPQSIVKVQRKTVITDSVNQSKKAVLKLADGSQIILSGAENGTLAMQGSSSISHENGQLIYKGLNSPLHVSNLQNTISTPKGGEFQITLLDGTKVWLNTESTLTYPVAFNGIERRVKITGEAYFEVAKNNRMPFIVEASGTEVKVLGTHFNVSAYQDDATVKTTLLEGSVKVAKDNHEALLTPGKQAISSKNINAIKVWEVDTEGVMAWKKGYFYFNNEDITTVMKVIGRWYDIEVEYEASTKGKTFGGTISRFENIEKMLNSIELTGAVHFKIEGRKVTVTP